MKHPATTLPDRTERSRPAGWPVIGIAVLLACGPDPLPVLDPGALPAPIAEFARSQGIDTLRGYTELITQPENDLTIFRLRWGNPRECRPMCEAFVDFDGILREGRVGWISSQAVWQLPPGTARFFDVLETDLPLFDVNLLPTLRDTDRIAYNDFRFVLACDADTPPNVLQAIAESLPPDGDRWLGFALLEHQRVLESEPILQFMARLERPSMLDLRDHAQLALDALRAGTDPPVRVDRLCAAYSGGG